MLGMRQGAFSDIYAIGAVCYRAIGGTVADALARQIALAGGRADPQPPAAEVGAGRYPAALLAAIDAALAVDATQRPQDVDAMLAALGRDEPVADATVVAPRRSVARGPVARGPVSTGPRSTVALPAEPQPGMQRWRGVWGVAAGVGVLVAIAALYWVLRGPATPPPAERQQVAASSSAPVPSSPVSPPQGQGQTAPPAVADDVAQPATAARGRSEVAPAGALGPAAPAEPQQQAAIAVPPTAAAPMPAPMPAPSASEVPPTRAPAPAVPTEPPQHEAMAVAPPAPAPTRAPTPAPTSAPAASEAASTGAPAAVSSAEPSQRQAMVVLPPASVPTPAPSPPTFAPPTLTPPALASSLERARAAASALPCSILHVANAQGGLRVSGFAPTGQDLDGLLGGLRDMGRVGEDIVRVDRFACGPMAAVDALVRRTWDATPPPLAMRLDQREVASGARLGIDVATKLPALYVDLYQSDGSVRHLLRPSPSGKPGKAHAEWLAGAPAGPRLVVAIGSAAPLDLGARPDSETAAEYVAGLLSGLERAAVPTFADVAMVTVHAGEPAVAPGVVPGVAKVPQARPTNVRSDRCANIVSRAQLGETLSDADRAALRAECRS
jgi:hypothetical protein